MVLTSFISSLELCTAVVARSAVTGPDSSRGLKCQLAHRNTMPQTWYHKHLKDIFTESMHAFIKGHLNWDITSDLYIYIYSIWLWLS